MRPNKKRLIMIYDTASFHLSLVFYLKLPVSYERVMRNAISLTIKFNNLLQPLGP